MCDALYQRRLHTVDFKMIPDEACFMQSLLNSSLFIRSNGNVAGCAGPGTIEVADGNDGIGGMDVTDAGALIIGAVVIAEVALPIEPVAGAEAPDALITGSELSIDDDC